MGMPRKRSRKVEVDGVTYLWRVRDGHNPDNHYFYNSGSYLWLTVQRDEERPGRVVQFVLESKRWADVSEYDREQGCGHNVTLTPADVRSLVAFALRQGWNPSERGTSFKGAPAPDAPELGDYNVGEWQPSARGAAGTA